MLRTAAIAALVLSSTAAFAQNTKRAPDGRGLRAIQIDCMKQHGATFDKARNAWVIPETSQEIMVTRLEAVYACVANRTGKPAQRFIREIVKYE